MGMMSSSQINHKKKITGIKKRHQNSLKYRDNAFFDTGKNKSPTKI